MKRVLGFAVAVAVSTSGLVMQVSVSNAAVFHQNWDGDFKVGNWSFDAMSTIYDKNKSGGNIGNVTTVKHGVMPPKKIHRGKTDSGTGGLLDTPTITIPILPAPVIDVGSAPPAVSAVPLPATLPLLLAGLGGLTFLRRKKA